MSQLDLLQSRIEGGGRLSADEDAVLFSFSDRPIHAALGVLRQERLG